jgi:predicted Zn-dependent protease
MIHRRLFRIFIGASASVLILIACAVNPVTGKRELMLVTEQEEIDLGKQTDEEIASTYGVYESPELTEYINRLGTNMAKVTHRASLEYHFKVLDTPVINAFAVPGGYVYVTRGILAYLNDEAELAGVVGHELGHVNARHTAQEMSKMQLAQLGLGIGMALSEKLQKYAGLAEFGVSMLFLKFSRDNERQADDLGVEYGSKSGYDTYRMASFFQTLERLSPGEGGGLPDWFSTHPNPVDRIGAINRKTAEWRQKLGAVQYAVKRDEYLKTVDGVIFGEDPRQGYVEGNAFYHPALKFTFPVPAEWQVNNTPAQIQIVSKDEDAVIQVSMAESASSAQAADEFVKETNAAVQSRERWSVNGLRGEKIVARLVSDEDTLQTQSYFIAKGGSVFVVHGLTGRDGFSKYSATFAKTAGGFRNLTDPAKINVTPRMLRTAAAAKGGTLRAVLRQMGAPEAELENLAVMNGMQLADNVAVGTRIKTVVE